MKEILTMLISLLIVLGIIYLTYWLCRRLPSVQQRMNMGQNIRVLEQATIGSNKQILLVQVAEQQYLLGCSEQNITVLDKLEKPIFVEEVPETKSFQQVLQKYHKGGE